MIDEKQNSAVKPLTLKEDLTLSEAEDWLLKVVSYSDYLAEQLKDQRIARKHLKKIYKQQKRIFLAQATGRDSAERQLDAEVNAASFLDAFEAAEIEEGFIRDLLDNNHEKAEALRTIISSKKTVWEKTYRN